MSSIFQRMGNASPGEWINFICFATSIVLAVVGFILPPKGQIDNSVLICIGELGLFSTISKIPDFIHALKNGGSVEVGSKNGYVKVEGADQQENNK